MAASGGCGPSTSSSGWRSSSWDSDATSTAPRANLIFPRRPPLLSRARHEGDRSQVVPKRCLFIVVLIVLLPLTLASCRGERGTGDGWPNVHGALRAAEAPYAGWARESRSLEMRD